MGDGAHPGDTGYLNNIEDPSQLTRQRSGHVPTAQVSFSSLSAQAEAKRARKEASRQAKAQQQCQPKLDSASRSLKTRNSEASFSSLTQ